MTYKKNLMYNEWEYQTVKSVKIYVGAYGALLCRIYYIFIKSQSFAGS